MLDSGPGRLVGVGVLLLLLAGVCVGFAAQTSVHRDAGVPTQDDIAHDADAHVGDLVTVSGYVVNTDPVVLAVEYNYYSAGEAHSGVETLTVRGVATAVSEGDVVGVYGRLDSPNALTATNVVVVPRGNFAYMYGVSLLGGLWVFARLLAGWRLDPRSLALHRRDPPHTVGGRVAKVFRRGS